MEKLFNVKINSPNFMIIFGEKQYRTPVLFEKINEQQLSFLKTAIKAYSIPKYDISEWKVPEVKEDSDDYEVVDSIEFDADNHEVVVEELFEDEPTSTLDKLLKESRE
jgi:hypothetical protein